MNEETIVKAAEGLISLLDDSKEVETKTINISVELPVTLLDLCDAICKEMGISGMEEKIIANMVKQGLLAHIRSMGITPTVEKTVTPPEKETSDDMFNLDGLSGLLDKMNTLGQRLEEMQGFFDEQNGKNNK